MRSTRISNESVSFEISIRGALLQYIFTSVCGILTADGGVFFMKRLIAYLLALLVAVVGYCSTVPSAAA